VCDNMVRMYPDHAMAVAGTSKTLGSDERTVSCMIFQRLIMLEFDNV